MGGGGVERCHARDSNGILKSKHSSFSFLFFFYFNKCNLTLKNSGKEKKGYLPTFFCLKTYFLFYFFIWEMWPVAVGARKE